MYLIAYPGGAMLRALALSLLFVACQAETAPPVEMVEPMLPAVASQAVAAPRMIVGASDEEIAAGGTTRAFDIGETDNLLVVVRFPTDVPTGVVLLDLINPDEALHLSYARDAAGHDVDFTVPLRGSRITKNHLTGPFTLVASVGGEVVATTTVTFEEVQP
jgi:hypothetical protein